MGFHNIAASEYHYGLIAFDSDGNERSEATGNFSDQLVQQLSAEPVTDVFFFCHGWKGDAPAAIQQYNLWIGSFVASADLGRAKGKLPGFHPMFLGLHWPSLPWGDEKPGNDGSFAAGGGPSASQTMQDMAASLDDTPEVRAQLQVLFDHAREDLTPDTLPEEVKNAYLKLNDLLGLAAESAASDADRRSFDSEEYYQAALENSSNFSGFSLGGLLSPLGQLSYWTMKKRARSMGEGGMHLLLERMQQTSLAKGVRFHLMGHSFGTIVVSGMLGGPDCKGTLLKPVDSVALVQGAVSLWSYAEDIPYDDGGSGYFHPILADHKVAGPLITTQSKFDLAVRRMYPLASHLHGGASFDVGFPELGGVGTFGLQGLGAGQPQSLPLKPATEPYEFQPGEIYNLEASQYICHGGGASGAHSDIAGPEVAHAIWEAALSLSA